jgi:hypothetical protein
LATVRLSAQLRCHVGGVKADRPGPLRPTSTALKDINETIAYIEERLTVGDLQRFYAELAEKSPAGQQAALAGGGATEVSVGELNTWPSDGWIESPQTDHPYWASRRRRRPITDRLPGTA